MSIFCFTECLPLPYATQKRNSIYVYLSVSKRKREKKKKTAIRMQNISSVEAFAVNHKNKDARKTKNKKAWV
jgi:hypothetical protein